MHLTAPSTAPGNETQIGTLPTGYIPTFGQNLPLASTAYLTGGQTPHLWVVPGSNKVAVYGIPASAIEGGTLTLSLN